MKSKWKTFEVLSISGNHVGYVKARNKEEAFRKAARKFGGNSILIMG